MAFRRIVQLTVGPAGQLGVFVSTLKIKFDVLKTGLEPLNKAVIEVCNMRRDGPQGADALGKFGNNITLSVGYEDEGVKTLFIGSINNSTYQKEGTETIWHIEAFDGGKQLLDTFINASYAAGTPVTSVLNCLVVLCGLPVAQQASVSGVFANGWAFQGRVSDALAEVLKTAQLRYTVVNNQFYFFAWDAAMPAPTATGVIELNARTGLLGVPEPLLEAWEKSGFSSEPPKKWKTKSIIFPQICPGAPGSPSSVVHLSSVMAVGTHPITGYYTVESAHFTGDNWDGEFLQETEMRAIS